MSHTASRFSDFFPEAVSDCSVNSSNLPSMFTDVTRVTCSLTGHSLVLGVLGCNNVLLWQCSGRLWSVARSRPFSKSLGMILKVERRKSTGANQSSFFFLSFFSFHCYSHRFGFPSYDNAVKIVQPFGHKILNCCH